ncbi:YnbE family lipoprotein [Fretibacter rubidus]|uniref:YnbE family lipoprotein n=1 Tax=Fretibacter rubidus TaxID=570162 RepID=UPI00352A4448
MMKQGIAYAGVLLLGASAIMTTGCQPKLQLVAPDKPIEINLNVKIDQQVRVRLDKDVEDLIANNPDLF